MIGDSQWIEGFLYKVMARARELINQQAHSFRDSLERWLALNWPVLMLPGWEVRFNNFLRDWRADGVILQPESAQQLFDYLNAQSEQMRAEGVQLPEQLPTLQSLLPTREQALRPADERHFPDDLPAPFDPAYPQLRRTGNSIMQRYPPEDWLRRAEQVLKSYRVPEEIAKQFLAWIAAEQKKRAAPAVPFLAELESFGPADLHPLAVCFAAGTPVITRRGPIAIEQVFDGDEVPAVPETDPLAPIRWCRVERAYHNNPAELIDIHVSGLPVIRTTLNHPFFVWGKGFIAAQRLCTGDLLRTADDRWLPISGTFRDGSIQSVYNLCVAGCHTYFAGGVLVHNVSPAGMEEVVRDRLPRTGGHWSGAVGDSDWILDKPIKLKGTTVGRIVFKGAIPDFDKFSMGNEVSIVITGDPVFDQAEAKKAWKAANPGKRFPKNYTFHHDLGNVAKEVTADGKAILKSRMQLIPSSINKIPHVGSAALARQIAKAAGVSEAELKRIARALNSAVDYSKGGVKLVAKGVGRARKLGSRLIPFASGFLAIITFQEDAKAHGIAGAVARATPVLGDLITLYDLGSDLQQGALADIDKQLREFEESGNHPIDLANRLATKQTFDAFNRLAAKIGVHYLDDDAIAAIADALKAHQGRMQSTNSSYMKGGISRQQYDRDGAEAERRLRADLERAVGGRPNNGTVPLGPDLS